MKESIINVQNKQILNFRFSPADESRGYIGRETALDDGDYHVQYTKFDGRFPTAYRVVGKVLSIREIVDEYRYGLGEKGIDWIASASSKIIFSVVDAAGWTLPPDNNFLCGAWRYEAHAKDIAARLKNIPLDIFPKKKKSDIQSHPYIGTGWENGWRNDD